ncbi:cysteine synthase [Desulfobulbus propionicus DSM 2032]|uniref:Cysteine--tRNA ligase n=1 Tax=Desulfobulbus propionicus (strain ATCC 33891 / DSM 2032 / VKM B-1956 / 1pr3) TaxID=577650 RepID=A0A7U3YQ39_DESPD|nr:cysteine--tRNA ligase [Desulfobulbus propionicus]ADW19311.1 cysteine synthase [Desulfobulbus propionicus DSM 2032]
MKLVELIGKTPLVELARLNPAAGKVQLLGKLESRNPGGSIKDRVALSMVEAAEKSGELTRDKILLEATSGNTGIGMAMVCAAKQYRCQLIMPESASIERRLIMQAYGAEIILTPAKRATDGAIEKAYALAREHPDRYFLADQFNNPANWQAHYTSTAPEIWQQTEGKVTDIIVTLGTSGTAMGLSRWFRDHHPEVRVIAVEPHPGHKIQGLKNMKESYKPGIFDKTLPHAIVNVADADAFATVRRLAAEEGVFAGMSSGAAMFVAMERAREIDGGCIVVILPDGGERYLSTPLFKQPAKSKEEASQLRLFNTMTRKKEVFQPIRDNRVTLYACGPTAAESPNIAHCRRLIVADLINRSLLAQGYAVELYMNFTDLDDNTITGAIDAGADLREFTGRYIDEFKQAIEALNVQQATGYPLASEHVGHMIEIAHDLIHKGYAYEKLGSIYFDISKFKHYGRLSGIDLSKIKIGQTVDLDNYEKDNPRDFTLLKRSTLAELKKGIFYETDWGNIRPGWHIECSAMSTNYLGETIDIHTASQDLLFPHHENEIAIAEALTGKPLANYWLHSGQLLMDGRKMAKETGNVVTLREVLDRGYGGRELRFMLLGVHYRKPLLFSFKRLNAARTALRRIDEYTRKLLCLPAGLPHPELASYVSELEQRFHDAINDDLNISGAIGALFNFIKQTNPVVQARQLDRDQKNDVLEALRMVNTVLGVLRLEHCPLTPEIDRLIRQRERARQLKDWTAADSAREELLRKGVTIVDTAAGPIWEQITEEVK